MRSRTPIPMKWAMLLLLVFITTTGWADWEDYKPSTMVRIVRERAPGEKADFIYEMGDFRYQVRLKYAGAKRPIAALRRSLITNWLKAGRQDPALAAMFTHEVRFDEGKQAYWLPVQSRVLPYIEREVKVGDVTTVYLVYAGLAKGDWVFLVNDFQP